MEKIAVLGGGNGAHTLAADLALKGFGVTIWKSRIRGNISQNAGGAGSDADRHLGADDLPAHCNHGFRPGTERGGLYYGVACPPWVILHFFNATLPTIWRTARTRP